MQRRDPKQQDRARHLRGKMPDAERLLWWKLREANRNGFHFRRQVPIRGYFADFAEHSAKLALELDGDQHGEAGRHAHDAARDRVIVAEGYCVLRFPNEQVFRDLDGVTEAIVQRVLQRRPPPDPAAPVGRVRR